MRSNNRSIMDEFRKARPDYEVLQEIVVPMLEKGIKKSGLGVQGIESRIKRRSSLEEKLNRKRDKYDALDDITDILGLRVITFFTDDVDKVAKVVSEIFHVDKIHSVDQREVISPTNFGYLSLHYICSLPKDQEFPENLTRIRFEVQMRSSLQHTWAEIEHDLGYKNDFGVPKGITREFAQVAGLLEVADKCFSEIRVKMSNYEETVRREISEDKAYDLPLDTISLREFMQHSKQFNLFMQAIYERAKDAEIIKVSPESYLENLDLLGVKTIGNLLELLEKQQAHALQLFEDMQAESELDEVVTSIGLYLLCQARLVWSSKSEKSILNYFRKTTRNDDQAERRTKRILALREEKHVGEKKSSQ